MVNVVPANQDTIDVPLALSQGEQIVIEGRAPVIVKTDKANGASVVAGKDLNRVSAATLDEAMTAKLSGANMQANSGAPGGGAQLRLRGISTINGQSSPLYVIDGVIISNVAIPPGTNAITAAAFTQGHDFGPLQGIPVSVKDLYGVRGFPVFAGTPKRLPPAWEVEGTVVTALRRQLAVPV